jgi:hypothetical protein
MAVNGKYLFGSTTDNLYLNSYTIGKNLWSAAGLQA